MQENSQNDVNGCVYILINVIRILNIVSSDKHEYYDNDKRDIVLTIKKSFYDFIESVSDKVSDIYNFSKEDLVICLLSLSSQAEYAVENANEAIKNAIEAKNEVLNIADKASQSGLAREFRKCTEELQQGKRGWLIAVTISIVCMFGVLIWSFVNIPSPISSEELTKEFLHRLPFLIPVFLLFGSAAVVIMILSGLLKIIVLRVDFVLHIVVFWMPVAGLMGVLRWAQQEKVGSRLSSPSKL